MPLLATTNSLSTESLETLFSIQSSSRDSTDGQRNEFALAKIAPTFFCDRDAWDDLFPITYVYYKTA